VKKSVAIDAYTESQRRILAQGRLNLATVHLREAEAIRALGKAPNACVHAAYYAMHHCAAAAILLTGGVGKRKSVPDSHEHVIQHYAKLVETGDDAARESAKWLNFARSMRAKADYNAIEGGVVQQDAEQVMLDAHAFFDFFTDRWKMQPSADSEEALWVRRNLELLKRVDDASK